MSDEMLGNISEGAVVGGVVEAKLSILLQLQRHREGKVQLAATCKRLLTYPG
jgi:hypothetical protein